MAGQADGSIYVNTELDPEGFKAGSDRMKAAVKSLESQVKQLGPTLKRAVKGDNFKEYRAAAAEAKSAIAEMEQELEALGHKQVATDQYKELTAAMDKAAAEADKLRERQKDMKASGVSESSRKWIALQEKIDRATEKVDKYNATIQQLQDGGMAFRPGSETAEYAALAGRIEDARASLVGMNSEADKAERKAHGIGAAFKKVAKTIGSGVVGALRGALSLTKTLVAGNRNYKKSFGGLISSAKKFTLSMLGARGVYAILRKAVSAYMDANQQLSAQLSSVWTSLGNLLGPIITKIINLVSTAISYVTAFLKLLGMTGSAAASAVSEAGGAAEKAQKTLTGFDEINAMQDNSSGGGGGGGAGAAALEDAQLPDWVSLIVDKLKEGAWAEAATVLTDKLNEMVDKVPWAAIGDKIGYYMNGVLTFLATALLTFDWKNLGSHLAEMLNGIITGVDWGNLGALLMWKMIILVQGLTGFFQTLDGKALGDGLYDFIMGAITAVNWPGCVGALSKAISDFIKQIDYKKLGTGLSTGMRTLLQTMNAAIENFDWRALGNKIADFINGIDWAGIIGDIATFVSNVVKGALNLLVGLAEQIDWAKLGHDIFDSLKNVVQNIDWGAIVSLAFELLGAVIGGAISLVVALATDFWNLLKEGWESTKSYFSTYIEEAGGNIIEGLWNGIKNAFANVGSWIVENIWNPFKEGFCNAFGIHSPSTKMAEFGGYIIEGLLQGLKGAWDTITGWFTSAWEGVKSVTSQAWSKLKSTVSSAWSSVKSTVTSVGKKIASSVSETWSNVKEKVRSNLETAKEKAASAWSSIKSTASTIGSNVSSAASSAWSKVKGFVTDNLTKAKNDAANAWTSIKNTASNMGSNISSAASSAWSSVKNSITNSLNNAKSAASTAWSNMKSAASTAVSNINSDVTSKFGSVYNTINSKISSAKTAVSNGFSNIKSSIVNNVSSAMSSVSNQNWNSVGSNIVYGLGNGLSNTWWWLRNQASTLASNLLSSVKGWLGIASPSKVFRDEVGWFIGLGLGEGIEESEKPILRVVSGVADAISDEFTNGDYDISIPTAQLNGSLTSFADKITDGFAALMEKLERIANGVTFATPAMAGNVIPFKAAAQGYRGGGSTSGDKSDSDLARSFETASARELALMREQNNLLRQLLEKDSGGGGGTIGASTVISTLERKNRRDGKTVVPVA